MENLNTMAVPGPFTYYAALFVYVLLLIYVLYCAGRSRRTKCERVQDKPGVGEHRAITHRTPAAITGKALFLQMNEEYFDTIFSAFLRSLMHAGYTLSDREVAPPSLYLLTEVTVDILARDVERARQEFMTLHGTDIEDDIEYQMQSGRARMFLIQLIGSCETLGWKVAPLIRQPEGECENSCSASR